MFFRAVALTSFAVMLAACGGSSTPVSETPVTPETPITPETPVTPEIPDTTEAPNAYAFTDIDVAAAYLKTFSDEVTNDNLTFGAEIPVAGAGQYDGVLSISLLDTDSDDVVVGTARIDVNFGDLSYTGSAGDFVNHLGAQTAGNVTFNKGAVLVSEDGGGIFGEIEGSITFVAGATEIAGNVIAPFYGSDGEELVGQVTSSEADETVAEFEGLLGVKRQ